MGKKGKKMESRLYYVQQSYSESWVTIEEFNNFKDAHSFIALKRKLDEELGVFNFYRVCICSLMRMDFIDF